MIKRAVGNMGPASVGLPTEGEFYLLFLGVSNVGGPVPPGSVSEVPGVKTSELHKKTRSIQNAIK